jgi:hypothetical protein
MILLLPQQKQNYICALCEKMKHSMLHISIKLLRLLFIFSHNAQIHVSHSNRDEGKVQLDLVTKTEFSQLLQYIHWII